MPDQWLTRRLSSINFTQSRLFVYHRNLAFSRISKPIFWTGPSDCKLFNSPCYVGRGGGLASIFKQNYCYRMLATDDYSSFELQMFVLELDNPVVSSVIYWPPKPHKDFINEFSGLLGGIIPNFNRLFILGDFNICVLSKGHMVA